MIELINLQLAYKSSDFLIGPVDFSIRPGEALALVGESGAGKSTVGLEVLGLLHYKGGRRAGGEVRTALRPDQIALIPQDPAAALDPLFSIGNQLAEVEPDGGKIKDALARVHLPLEKISLKSYPHELSGGMRQRVVIAMALLRNPRLIVADEPTSSLDVTIQAEIMKLFREIKASGISFLFITHHLPLAAYLCDRAVILKDGKIVEAGSAEEIFKNPSQEYTKMLLESVPRIKK